jgi:tRNA 5-methylaminomethyl-2-thiouridine biosynthesis bifunctional protein
VNIEIPRPALPIPSRSPQHIAIVGAGIAGCILAQQCITAGFVVTLVERSTVASGASGNPLGLVREHPSATETLAGEFTRVASTFATEYYATYAGKHWQPMPNAHITRSKKMLAHWCNRTWPNDISLVTQGDASKAIEHNCSGPALLMEHAGTLAVADFCNDVVNQLSENSHFNIFTETRVTTLEEHGQGVRLVLHTANGKYTLECDTAILTNAHDANSLLSSTAIPFDPVRGQLSWTVESPAVSPTLKCAVGGHGYIAPMFDADSTTVQYCFGATYDRDRSDIIVDDIGHQNNLASLSTLLPELSAVLAKATLAGRVSIRATTPDRMPLAGWLYETKRVGILSGLGSRGLTWAPILAAHIVSVITHTESPLNDKFVQAIHAQRFNLIK